MKTTSILILALTIALAFDGCKKEEDKILPTASFTYEPADVMQYEEVQFTSTSVNAKSYSWDFGNQQVSVEANPKLTFMSAGTATVKLTATNDDGSNTTEQTITVNPPDNHYMLGDTKFAITTDFFWYSAMGSTYLRLLTDVDGQDNPDLLKLYPNQGLGELPRTYTWEDMYGENFTEGNYDQGYTANYAGMAYDWTSIGKAGSSDLVIQEVETDVYQIKGDMILSVGTWDFSTGEFTETGTETLKVNYVGAITPLQ